MSTLKAVFDESGAERLLRTLYPNVHSLTALTGGEASRAYAFSAGDRRLVLRVNHLFAYQRDAWASGKFEGTAVTAPQVLKIGQAGSHFWAVSEMAPGTMLSNLALCDIEPVQNDLVQILIAVHETPIPDSTGGFGRIDDTGNAAAATWHEFLVGDGRYGSFVDWDKALARAEASQRSLVEKSWSVADTLLEICPEERAFAHGDYNLDNILSDGRRITGVVDWSNCLYGDPVWDVAWTDLWTAELQFASAYFQLKPSQDGELRLLCYKLLIAAESLGFYIHTEQSEKGHWLESRLDIVLQEATRWHPPR
ncbi:MAG: aminoglycoside phosphotransferase family protein [Chloroflexota bacterium]|nr:aminoglycoside phosphotransferase family protein [Chloroflexota bacterium]